jgi:photosystem II stability/assembly factor-like uncharacterized protein
MRRPLRNLLLLAGLFILTGGASAQTKGIWEAVNYSEDIDLRDVFFVTPEIGYVSGDAGTLLKTTDAGASWMPLLGGDPQSQERAIGQLWFVSPTVGWAAQVTSSHTNLLHTTDGETWTRIGQIAEHYEDLAFANETTGVFTKGTDIFQTRDAGKTWAKVFHCSTKAQLGGLTRETECNLWKVRYATPTLVYALGQSRGDPKAAFILKSEDAGATWSVVSLMEDELASEGGLFFLDEKVGYFSTKYGKAAYRTTDGGVTWTGMPATAIHRRIVFADPDVGWSMQFKGLSYTTDGGKRWFSREIPFPAMVNAFSLPRRDRAYAVGDHGMIYRYSVVPQTAAVTAKALAFPAMPGLDNGVLLQLAQLDTRIDKLGTELRSATSASSGDWTSTPVGQELTQMQAAIDTVSNGVPAMARKHRSLNLLSFGLQLLSDVSAEGSELRSAFTSLRQSKDLNSVSQALQQLNGQVEAMKTSVQTFASARKTGG